MACMIKVKDPVSSHFAKPNLLYATGTTVYTSKHAISDGYHLHC